MRIAWLAAVQPQYREPMWTALAELTDLEISFFLPEDRARHLAWRPHPGYRSRLVRSRRLPLPARVAARFDEPVVVLAPGAARRLLHGADALVIHVWWEPANLWAALRAWMRGIPYLIYAESTLESREFSGGPAGALRSLVFRRAGAVVVPGWAAAEAAIADGAAPERIVHTVNSVDLDQFDRRVRELRKSLPETASPSHRFLCLGQLIPRKNVDTLIRAFAGLSGAPTLEIAGDGVELPRLEALAGELGVADRVRFLGYVDPADVPEVLARNHTLVLPSTEEVYGYTALEAYVAGLQVVVSDCAGVAPNLADQPGTWMVSPATDPLRAALDDARTAWTGWRDDADLGFASPHRAAEDIVRAVGLASAP